MTIEEQIKEAENSLQKLREDIVSLEVRRGSLQNEVNKALAEAKEKSDKDYIDKLNRYNAHVTKKNQELEGRQKYLDGYMVELDHRKEDLDVQQKYLEGLTEKNKMDMEDFEAQKKKDLDNLNSVSAQIKEKGKVLEESLSNLEKSNAAIEVKEIELNTLKLSIQKASDINTELLKKMEIERQRNEEILFVVHEKEKSIKEESELIKGILDEIQAKREELVRLSVYKDDIMKLEQMREDNKKELEKIKAYSKQVELRDIKVTEKEITQDEKAKYLMLKEREVSGKINTLNEIRKGSIV